MVSLQNSVGWIMRKMEVPIPFMYPEAMCMWVVAAKILPTIVFPVIGKMGSGLILMALLTVLQER